MDGILPVLALTGVFLSLTVPVGVFLPRTPAASSLGVDGALDGGLDGGLHSGVETGEGLL